MYLPFCALRDSGTATRPRYLRKGPERPQARRSVPFLLAAVGLALVLVGRAALAEAATLVNHMDAWESVSLWCQDPRQQWVEHTLSGPLDPDQQVAFALPSEPCFFLEIGLKKSLLNFSIPQELRDGDALEVNYSPYGDLSLDVSRQGEPLFSAEGTEKDRGLARDPDRHPPDPVETGPLLTVLRMGLPKAQGLALGLPCLTVDESLEVRTALLSDGVIWKGSLYFYEDTLSIAALTTPLTMDSLEKWYSELAAQGYRHAEESEEAISFTDDPALSPDATARKAALEKLLADLAAPEAEPYEVMFLPADGKEPATQDGKETMQVQMRIAPGTSRIEITLNSYEAAEE